MNYDAMRHVAACRHPQAPREGQKVSPTMRQIIEGKLYDTSTARELYAWTNGRYATDFGWRSKTLYRTTKGVYFLHHEGGAMTDVSVAAKGGGRGGGEQIEPISEIDAVAFLESRGPDASAALLEHFPDHVQEA